MSRTISAPQQAEIVKTVTTPVYLVELGFNTPLYYSSRQAVIYDGNTYIANKILPVKLTADSKGILKGTVSISNIDLAIGAVALAETLQGKMCKVSTTHTTGASAPLADVEIILEGIVNGVTNISEKEVTLSINSINSSIMYTPRIYCAPNLFNHAIPAGTIITWGDSTYELVGDS